MLITVANVFAQATGSPPEMEALRQCLTVYEKQRDSHGGHITVAISLLRGDGRFYAGLVPRILNPLALRLGPSGDLEVKLHPKTHVSPISWDRTVPLLEGITLRDYQVSTVGKCLKKRRGVVQLATGGGKSVIFQTLSRIIPGKSVVLVNASNLMTQLALSYRERGFQKVGIFGGVPGKDLAAVIAAGVRVYDHTDEQEFLQSRVFVCMVQSLHARLTDGDLVAQEVLGKAQLLVIDEVHGAPAKTFASVVSKCSAPYRFGFSGTPFVEDFTPRHNFRDLSVIGLTGELIAAVPYDFLIANGYIAAPEVFVRAVDGEKVKGNDWSVLYPSGIVRHKARNKLVVESVMKEWDRGGKILVVVLHKKHGHTLLASLARRGVDKLFLSCGQREIFEADLEKKLIVRSELSVEDVHRLIEVSPRIVIVGTPVYDQGLDIPELDACVIAAGGKKLRLVLQRPGRIMRPKSSARVYDFDDAHSSVLHWHYLQRKKIYEKVGWKVTEERPPLLGLPPPSSSAFPTPKPASNIPTLYPSARDWLASHLTA